MAEQMASKEKDKKKKEKHMAYGKSDQKEFKYKKRQT